MSAQRILYLSYFYPQDVVKSRRLPTRNIAGNNRMKRITGALARAGHRVHIVSPGICAQCGFTFKLFQGTYTACDDDIDVTVAPAVVIPIVGAILEIFLFPLWMLLLLRRGRYDGAIFYNYSLSFVLVAIILRTLGIPFVAQVEDVAVPARSDWRVGGETRPVQQLILWLCMKMVASLSAGLMVPSQRFRPYLPKNKPCLVIPGCVADSEWGENRPVELRTPIRVLFVGPYQIEHGVDLFLAALKLLRSGGQAGAHYAFDCCGTQSYPAELQSLTAAEGTPPIQLHGLLSDGEYRNLLAEAAVALVLQKGQGRHATLKSPSKAYEFLAAGKLVITTDVGDLASHAGDHLIMLKNESAEELVGIFEKIAENPQKFEKIALAARDFSRREWSYEAVGKNMSAFLTHAFSDRRSWPQGSVCTGADDTHSKGN
jgi:glycosyltransferase involved in cell wall biosynthesis